MINLQLCAVPVQLWANNENVASVASVSVSTDTEFRRSLKSTLPTLRLVSVWSMKFQAEGWKRLTCVAIGIVCVCQQRETFTAGKWTSCIHHIAQGVSKLKKKSF